MLDCGANGSMAGNDCHLLAESCPACHADVTGVGEENNHIEHLKIGTYGGKTITDQGPIVLIMNEYAGYGKGRTIHPCPQ